MAGRSASDAPLRDADRAGTGRLKPGIVRNGARFGVANLSFITAKACAVNGFGEKMCLRQPRADGWNSVRILHCNPGPQRRNNLTEFELFRDGFAATFD